VDGADGLLPEPAAAIAILDTKTVGKIWSQRSRAIAARAVAQAPKAA
jgi:hypothetical protein